jgi:hypothetical protein
MQRISNIEFRSIKGISDKVEIVKWIDNLYFGQTEKYQQNGYVFNTLRHVYTKGNHQIAQECFTSEKSCYVIAFVSIDLDESGTEFRGIGSRLLELSESERIDFFKVYESAHKFLLTIKDN